MKQPHGCFDAEALKAPKVTLGGDSSRGQFEARIESPFHLTAAALVI